MSVFKQSPNNLDQYLVHQRQRTVGASCALFYAVDSGMFVTSSYDDRVRFWDTNAMESVLALPFFEKVYHLAVPRTNAWTRAGAPHALTAAAVADGSVALCDQVSGSAAHTLAGVHRGAVMCCAWSTANANQIASGGSDGVVAVWDIRRSASALVQLTAETESAHTVARQAAAAAAVSAVSPTAASRGPRPLWVPAGPGGVRPADMGCRRDASGVGETEHSAWQRHTGIENHFPAPLSGGNLSIFL